MEASSDIWLRPMGLVSCFATLTGTGLSLGRSSVRHEHVLCGGALNQPSFPVELCNLRTTQSEIAGAHVLVHLEGGGGYDLNSELQHLVDLRKGHHHIQLNCSPGRRIEPPRWE
ncbi:hypothetical protein T492DRAFT_145161 [Pavlovales sp. CCMP2436]|nr:hypothetical protein T492DRAFT_145161 [Pavlovales sp. CCMP2436]